MAWRFAANMGVVLHWFLSLIFLFFGVYELYEWHFQLGLAVLALCLRVVVICTRV